MKPPASLFRAVEPSPGATAPSGVAAFPAADSGEPSRRIRWPRLAVIVVAVLALAAAGRLLYAPSAGVALYRVARVERGRLTATVSATGTLNAVVTVQVGSQISGQIRELHADFNAIVKKGQLIARIDPAPFQAAVDQARADVDNALAARRTEEAAVEKARAEVENAKAAVAVAHANTAKAQVAVVDARRDLGRDQRRSDDRGPGGRAPRSRECRGGAGRRRRDPRGGSAGHAAASALTFRDGRLLHDRAAENRREARAVLAGLSCAGAAQGV